MLVPLIASAIETVRWLIVMAYLFLVRHNLCPCMLARRVDQACVFLFRIIARSTAYIGGHGCHALDHLVRERDGVCGPDCQGCRPSEVA